MHIYSDDKHVWDVKDLWKEAEKYKVKSVQVSKLLKKNSPEDILPKDLKSLYFYMKDIDSVNMSFPIITYKGFIVDGCHRYMKAVIEEQKEISIIELDKMPAPLRKDKIPPRDNK